MLIERLTVDPPGFPQVSRDVSSWILFEHSRSTCSHIIGSRSLDRYIALSEPKARTAMVAIRLMDGTRSLEEISAAILEADGVRVDVRSLYERLSMAGLVEGAERPPAGALERLCIPVFAVPVERFFRFLAPPAARVARGILALSLAVALGGLWVGLVAPGQVFDFRLLVSSDGSWLAAFGIFGVLMLLASAFHELSHGVAALCQGLVPHEFGMKMYLGFVPVLYLRIRGLYTVGLRSRLTVFAAGVVGNLVLAGAALILWRVASLPSGAQHLALKFALANLVMVVQNLIPFLPSDGYLLLMSLLGQSNVRTSALAEFQRWRSGQPHRLKGWLAFYFVASVATLFLWLAWAAYRGHLVQLIVLGLVVIVLGVQGRSVRARPHELERKSRA